MKSLNRIFIAVVAVLLCVGCTQDGTSDNASQVSNQQVSLSFFETSLQPLQEKRSLTRADDSGSGTALTNTAFTYLHIALIPVNGQGKTIILQQSKSEVAENFGHVKLSVPIGEYHLVAVASKNAQVQINSLTEIIFPDKVTDMGYMNMKIDVKSGNNSYSCALKRAVAKFMITDTGNRSADITSLIFHLSGNCSNKLNPTTGLAADISDVNPVVAAGSSNKYVAFVFLSSAEEKNIHVSVELKNVEGTTLKTLNFENVHMKTNYVTEYKGALYDLSGMADFTFSDGDFIDSGTGKTFGE